MDTTGTITSFSSTPMTRFSIGGDVYGVQDASTSYSLTNPDSQTLRFQVQQGDHAWYDSSSVDRSEVSAAANIPGGTPLNLNYQFMVEANGPNGSFANSADGWFIVGQMHNDDNASGVGTSPPFAIQLVGDHLQVVARYVQPGQDPSNGAGNVQMLTLWTDPNPIQTGVYNNIQIQADVSNTGGGYLKVSINGTQVVNYSGPLGYGQGTNWEYGVYRSTAPETVAVDYRNMTLLTGASATVTSPSTPTQPTTPTTTPTTVTSPTTIVAPAVAQDTTSPAAAIAAPAATVTAADPGALGAMGAMGAMGMAPTSASGWSTPAAAPTTASLAGLDFSRFGFDTSTLATAAPQTTSWWGDQGTAAASQASNSYALLNQYLAGSSGGANGGMIAVAMSGPAWTQNSFLTKPQS
ncbi:heparin lyase I family protein [Bradyrhizobium sp. Pear77]|uniref:heparin lyase I family protein n=1 Tax=Bradyrhizobium altum TaxID=1571202 RepID=UPI001E5C7F2C|nr:heparin lyase I family protein [Bradyrhizobium altum]MCC8952440.1 heparin lyase I family protein [Bradyrhizobium altum]